MDAANRPANDRADDPGDGVNNNEVNNAAENPETAVHVSALGARCADGGNLGNSEYPTGNSTNTAKNGGTRGGGATPERRGRRDPGGRATAPTRTPPSPPLSRQRHCLVSATRACFRAHSRTTTTRRRGAAAEAGP